jgi:hypothetical protein
MDQSLVSDLYQYAKGGKKIIRKSKKTIRKTKKTIRKSKKNPKNTHNKTIQLNGCKRKIGTLSQFSFN